MKLSLARYVPALLASGALAQQGPYPCPYPTNQWRCGVGMFNQEIGGVVEFPNFRTPQGNHRDDALWKVYPKELFLRARRDTNFVSGVTVPLKIHNFATGERIVLPAFEIRFAIRDTSGHLVPDFVRPPFVVEPIRATQPWRILLDRYWFLRPQLMGGGWKVVPDVDLAVVIRAEEGKNHLMTDQFAAWRSTKERYDKAPQPSFSGRYNGATGQLELLIPPLVPEASELAMELCFWEGVARVSATSSKSGPIEDWELATGVGAFYNDLASRGGRVRWYFETPSAGGNTPWISIIPVLTLRRLDPPVQLPILRCFSPDPIPVDFDATNPFALILYHLWGVLPATWRSPYSSFDNALTTTPWIDVPQDAALRDAVLYVGAVTVSSNQIPFLVTNLVQTTLR